MADSVTNDQETEKQPQEEGISFTSSLCWKGCSLHRRPPALLSYLGHKSTSPTYFLTASSSDQALTTPSFEHLFLLLKALYFLLSCLLSLLLSFLLSSLLSWLLSWLLSSLPVPSVCFACEPM